MGELARLPELTGDELGELETALAQRMAFLGLEVFTDARVGAVLADRVVTCQSLLTAVREARYSLERGDDDA